MPLDDPLCVFSATVERRDGTYVLEVPESEVDLGTVAAGGVYRAALHPVPRSSTTAGTDGRGGERAADRGGPPVSEGDRCRVTIEDLGEQGDGLARIGPGYVVFVPDTTVGEEVTIEITDARENVAFGTVTAR